MSDGSSSKFANPTPKRKHWFSRLCEMFAGKAQNRQEMIEQLRDAESRHLLDGDALAMIEGVLNVSDLQARDIMVPRSQMFFVNENEKIEEYLPKMIEIGHSRFPVVGDNKDQIIGVLHAKELLMMFIHSSKEELLLRQILRPAFFIPESKRLNILLKEFRANHTHMAIVVDEYGNVSGLVTIEDVLEQIVGEIEDEFDDDEEDDNYIKKQDDHTYTLSALTPIEFFNSYFQVDLSDEEVDTVGGLIIRGLEHVPQRGETYVIGHFHFKVLSSDKRRIRILECLLHHHHPKHVEKK